jgi:hypothetical protein
LRKLSRALSVYQMPNDFASPERFRSRVMLRLPRPEDSGRRLQAWVWWMVPFSLASVLVILLALMALPTVTVWGASVVRWIGLGDPLAALQAPGADFQGMISDLLGSTMFPLVGIAWQMLLCALLILFFVPYVGWVGMLARARQRSDVQKGGTRGPF